MEARLNTLYTGIVEVIQQFRPSVLAVEQLYAHYEHPRTAILMGHARGVVLLAAGQNGLPVISYNATRIKKTVTGNGRAGKDQVQRTIQRELSLAQLPEPPDVADALAAALCHHYAVQKLPACREAHDHTDHGASEPRARRPGPAASRAAGIPGAGARVCPPQIQHRTSEELTLHTSEYLDGNMMQGRVVPRLIGFSSEAELEFFELFCTVDKVGTRKAMKALIRPIREIADAIQRQDSKWFTTLPGVVAATAEQIIATLRAR